MAEYSTRSSGRWPRAGCEPERVIAPTAGAEAGAAKPPRAGRSLRRRGKPCPLRSAVLAIVALLSLSSQPGGAQVVLGQLFDGESGTPVEGALVLLLTEEGDEAGGYLTNAAGRFLIQAPKPGTYTLRAERIGFETTLSEAIRLDRGERYGIRLTTSPIAIQLDELRVEGEQRCVVRPGEGMELAHVWEEARKALTVQEWTERERAYRFQISRYERELDPTSLAVRSESRQLLSGISESPIRSRPAEELLSEGFIRVTAGREYQYFGPDAAVLLSDLFLDTHCFRLARNPNRAGQIGLSFEPVRRGGIPDISGTLWLDEETAGLRVLEYGYTWSPWEEVQGVARGRVEFENLPNGAWIVRRWWIRMPVVTQTLPVSSLAPRSRVRLEYIKEEGSEVTRFSSLDQEVISEVPRGILEGQVWDSTRNVPLSGATVFLSGTQYAAETDSTGGYLLLDLPAGTFSAAFTHPRLDSLGTFPSGIQVEIAPGTLGTLNLAIPATAGIRESTCTEEELARGSGVVLGIVRDGRTGAPVAGANVTVEWISYEGTGVEHLRERTDRIAMSTDANGRYATCGVPRDETLTVQARYFEAESEVVQAQLNREGYVVVNLEIQGRGSGIPPQL